MLSLAPFIELTNRIRDNFDHVVDTYLARDVDGNLMAVAIFRFDEAKTLPDYDPHYHYDVERYDGKIAEVKTIGTLDLEGMRRFVRRNVAVGGTWMTLHEGEA
jgi:hypothetical protein